MGDRSPEVEPAGAGGRLRLAYLDGLRALAALTVLVCHLLPVMVPWQMSAPDWLKALCRVAAPLSTDAVALFIVLSGFCLMLPLGKNDFEFRKGVGNFFLRRAWRILPPYYISMLLSWLIMGVWIQSGSAIYRRSFPITDAGLWTHLSLTQNVFRNGEFNAVLWSVAVECQIYLLFPLMLLLWRKWTPLAASCTIAGAAFVLDLFTLRTWWHDLYFVFYALFALGNLGAFVATSDRFEKARSRVPWLLIALALVSVEWGLFGADPVARRNSFRILLAGLAGLSLALSAGQKGFVKRALEIPPLAKAGGFSYSIYLVHLILLEIGLAYLRPNLGSSFLWVMPMLAIPAALVGAYLFHLAFEKPFAQGLPDLRPVLRNVALFGQRIALEPIQEGWVARRNVAYLDGLRALAAVGVVTVHAVGCVLPVGERLSGIPGMIFSTANGALALRTFVVLSGVCLTLRLFKQGNLEVEPWQFYRKRFRRVVLPYWFAMAACMLLAATCLGEKTGNVWDPALAITTKGTLAHLLLIQNVAGNWEVLTRRGDMSINIVFWSIAVEWQIYLIFPWLLRACRRFGVWQVAVVGAPLSFAAMYLLLGTRWVGLNINFVGLFLIGMVASYLAYSPGSRLPRLPFAALSLATSAVYVGLTLWSPGVLEQPGVPGLLIGPGLLGLIVWLSQSPNAAKALAWRPLAGLGRCSYSLYLLHLPLLQLVYLRFVRNLGLPAWESAVLLMSIGIPVVLIVSYLFHLACERPFLRSLARPAVAVA